MEHGKADEGSGTIIASIELALDAAQAFDLVVGELTAALLQRGVTVEPGREGRIFVRQQEVARAVEWTPGERIVWEWHPADWQPERTATVELRASPVDGRARITLEHRGLQTVFEGADEVAAWFARMFIAPWLDAMTPAALGDWLTDRMARSPSGARARDVYRDPLFHYPNFRVILSELVLTAEDYLLEVGCGGGALLREALRSGCRAAAVDHSPDMVALARQENREAVRAGRLDVRHAEADQLPFADATFTCAAMTGVLGFLPDPVGALAEIRRVLVPGGRLVILGSDPELRGTPAAPEPFASRLRFYDDEQLRELAREAGFGVVRVEHRDLEPHAREAGVPEEFVSLFGGPGARFLLALKEAVRT